MTYTYNKIDKVLTLSERQYQNWSDNNQEATD